MNSIYKIPEYTDSPDPYEAIGSPLRVHHPVQPKTQVERWREEIENNYKAMSECKNEIKELEECENCYKRWLKNAELIDLISQDHEKNKRFIGRTPTGTFADDI